MDRQGEVLNTVTHGIGFILSVIATVALILKVAEQNDIWRLIGCSIFGVTLIAVYAASTLSHAFSDSNRRQLFRKLDQGFIYLLIVGTYTPFGLTFLRSGGWLIFLAAMWLAAIFGCVSKIWFSHRIEAVAIWTYVVLGWLPVFPAFWLLRTVPFGAMVWMLAGGACYTIGTIFLVLDLKRFHFHAIWHLLVISGSTCHYIAILFFVADSVSIDAAGLMVVGH